jgi:hypothetical protein
MKQKFLILSVAFLFCGAGCGVRKKSPILANQVSQKKQISDQQSKSDLLIKRSSERVVRDSSYKNKKEETLTEAPVEQQAQPSKKYSVKERIVEIEARLGDMPLPFMAKKVFASDDGDGRYFIISKTDFPLADIIHFYAQEMERLGWVKVFAFEHTELLFSFKKQKQSCIVSVRPGKQSWWSKKSTLLYVYLQA